MATKFCTVAPNICGSRVWNLLRVTYNFELCTRLLENVCTPEFDTAASQLLITFRCMYFIGTGSIFKAVFARNF